MRDQEQLHEALLALEPQPGRQRVKHCPLGSGTTPGLSWRYDGQVVLLTCHDHGHSYQEVADALGVQDAPGAEHGPRLDRDTFGSASARSGRSSAPGEEIRYLLRSTRGDLEKVRTGDGPDKEIRYDPAGHPSGADERWYIPPGQDWPDRGPVFVTEGEKVADALAGIGWPVVSFGAGGTVPTLEAIELAGVKGRDMILVADNDPKGIAWIGKMAEALEGAGCTVELLEGVWGPGEDAADYLAPGATAYRLHHRQVDMDASLMDALASTPWATAMLPEALLASGIMQASDVPIPLPPAMLHSIVLDQPGRVTALYAEPGVGKSTLAADVAARMTRAGDNVLVLDYEGVYDTEWIPRVRELGGDLTHLWIGEPPKSFQELTEHLVAMVRGLDARLVVVDSLLFSLGDGDAIEAGTAASWRRTANKLPCPIVAIGHTPKGGDTLYGSQAWTALARLVWHLKPDPKGNATYILAKAKGNHLPRDLAYPVQVEFTEAMLGQGLPCRVEILGTAEPEGIDDKLVAIVAEIGPEASTSAVVAAYTAQQQDGETPLATKTVLRRLKRLEDAGRLTTTKTNQGHLRWSDTASRVGTGTP